MVKRAFELGLRGALHHLQRRQITSAVDRASRLSVSQTSGCGCGERSGREEHLQSGLFSAGFPSVTQHRQLNIFSVFSKEARKEEAERLKDELNRGYFDDFKELKETGGKVTAAGVGLIPVAAAKTFPFLTVRTKEGGTFGIPHNDTLPSKHATLEPTTSAPDVTVVCIAFRASGQSMVESWSQPCAEQLAGRSGVQLYEVSMVESPVLSSRPIQSLILPFMKTPPSPAAGGLATASPLCKKFVYSFGDTYHFRKALGIQNRLTGYVYLLDKKGRIRWQGSGTASAEEIGRLVMGTEAILKEARTLESGEGTSSSL